MQADTRPIIAGKYAIEWEVDAGAMGRVFAAKQLGLDRSVALKIMSESSEEFRRRFLVEAHSMARMNHRNIVTIFDSGETHDGLVFIVMEYLRGRTLADAIKVERRCEVLRALHLVTQVARGLRAAHRQGVIHRDLKPSNIFLVDDEDEHEVVKVFDFGVAKARALPMRHVDTRSGVIVGTPAYMAPEQIDGSGVDARTDLYALGVVLYLLLTGRTPFIDSSSMQLMLAHLNKTPPSPRTICATIPESVDALVMRLLAKKPADRFADCDALLAALAELMVEIGGEAFRPKITDVHLAPPLAATGLAPPPMPSSTEEGLDARELLRLPMYEPLPRIDSPSPRTPVFMLPPPRSATEVLEPSGEGISARPPVRSDARRDAREVSATRDRRERRLTTFALGAILLFASAAAVSRENVLWTAFVAMRGAEEAVAQDTSLEAVTPPPPISAAPVLSAAAPAMTPTFEEAPIALAPLAPLAPVLPAAVKPSPAKRALAKQKVSGVTKRAPPRALKRNGPPRD